MRYTFLACVVGLVGCGSATHHGGSVQIVGSPSTVEYITHRQTFAHGQDFTHVATFWTDASGKTLPLSESFTSGPGLLKVAAPAATSGIFNVAAARQLRPSKVEVHQSGGGAHVEQSQGQGQEQGQGQGQGQEQGQGQGQGWGPPIPRRMPGH
jgi:hypothetical protein